MGVHQGFGEQPTELKELAAGLARDPSQSAKRRLIEGKISKSVSGLHLSIFTRTHTHTCTPPQSE